MIFKIEKLWVEISEITADIELINAQLLEFDAINSSEEGRKWYSSAKAARSGKQRMLCSIVDEYNQVVSDSKNKETEFAFDSKTLEANLIELKSKANRLQRLVDGLNFMEANPAERDRYFSNFRSLKALRQKAILLENYIATMTADRSLELQPLTAADRDVMRKMKIEEDTLLQECNDIQTQMDGYDFKNDMKGRTRQWFADAKFTLKQKRLRIRELQQLISKFNRRDKNSIRHDFERLFVDKAKEVLPENLFGKIVDLVKEELQSKAESMAN